MAKEGDVTGFKSGSWVARDLSELPTTIYLGPPGTDGSYRLTISGADLLIQRYTVDAWVTRSTIAGGD